MRLEADWRERLAAAIADGREIDWTETEAPADAPEIPELHDLERIARAYSVAARSAREPAARRNEPTLFSWGGLEVLERVGEGAFGEVYRAYDPVLEREVALKLRREGPSAVGGSGRRYLEEARRLARVRHPHVLAVYGAAVHDGRVGLWTELVAGASLEERLERHGPLATEQIVRIGLDLTSALAAIHAAGLAHGDVKAANVLLDSSDRGVGIGGIGGIEGLGRVVLADLSAARELDGRPGGALEGTPLAMAPELLDGGSPSPSSDLYALGALLFRLVTGRHPVEAATLAELQSRLASSPPPPLAALRPDLPVGLCASIDRALCRDPGDRFASAEEMAAALTVALEEPARLEAIVSRTRERRRRRATTWALSGALMLVVCTGLWLSLRSRGALPENLDPTSGSTATSRLEPVDPEAGRLYETGLELLRQGNARDAVVPLTRAAELAPRSAGPWFALAQAQQARGDHAAAVEPARTAFRLATALPEVDRRRIEVLYYRMTHDWDSALAAVRAAVAASPGDPELELSRVQLEIDAGRPQDALALLDSLQASGAPGSRDARFALARCAAYQRTGDWQRLLESAREAQTTARLQASPALEARALFHQATTLCFLGRPQQAAPLAAEAVRIADTVDDPRLTIDVLNALATVRKYSHERAGAEAAWRQALSGARKIGDRDKEHQMLYNLAILAGDQGNLLGLVGHGREALAICNELQLEADSIELSTMLGGAILYTGPIAEAHQLLQTALDYHRRLGQRSREGEALAYLAEWAQKRDDLPAAGRFTRQWLALAREQKDPRMIDWPRANEIWVALDGGADVDPDGEIAAIAQRAHDAKDTDLEGMTRAMRSLAALRRGRADLAASESRLATELVPPPVSPFLCYFNWWIRGEVLLARGELAELDREVPKLLDLTRRLGVLSEELEGRLLAANLAAAHGELAAARSSLADLAAEARAKGYLRTARRATQALERLGAS